MNANQPVSREIVKEYVKRARKSAKTPSQQSAVAQAALLIEERGNLFAFGLQELFPKQRQRNPSSISPEVPWRNAILKEVHIALCSRSRKYAKEMAALKGNVKLLIGAIAGYVAASIDGSVAIIAALVAAFLHVIFKVGVSAFCERYREQFSKPRD
jgi:hypothetical protein